MDYIVKYKEKTSKKEWKVSRNIAWSCQVGSDIPFGAVQAKFNLHLEALDLKQCCLTCFENQLCCKIRNENSVYLITYRLDPYSNDLVRMTVLEIEKTTDEPCN